MGNTTEGGNFVDHEGGLGMTPPVKGIHTGDVKTHMSQSAAGEGAQGPVIPTRRVIVIPPPKDETMPDG